MASSPHAARYGSIAQAAHWIVFLLVVALFAIAWYMTGLPLGPEKIRIYNLHKSIGVLVLALMVLRLVWRRVSPPPPLPSDMADWERLAARASHILLYTLLLAQPLVGIVHSWSANFPVVVFGLFTLPNLTGPSEALKEFLGALHFWIGWGLLGLIAVHAAAALRHHFVLRDDVLRRMLPGGKQ